MLKLAFRNVISKPLRTLATILAIAVVVAMTFCMISFKDAVYDYIYATETSGAGSADIVISTNSSSDRITTITPLKSVDEAKEIVATLKLYALCEDEYVMVRGFDAKQLEVLQKINVVQGDIDSIVDGTNEDNVVISEKCAEHFGLSVGEQISLSLGDKHINCYVGAIAKQDGYFLSDSPYQMIGTTSHFSRLITGSLSATSLCNEIYVIVKDGVSIEDAISKISSLSAYEGLLVKEAKDSAYVEEQTQSLTAPVVLAGGAVFLLGIAIVVILFMMSEGEKVSLIAKLKVVGATKRQICGIFLIESVFLAMIGALVGSALAVGIFVLILRLTLSSTLIFNISAIYLFIAGIVGFFSAVITSLFPVVRAFKGSIRDNQLDIKAPPKALKILPFAMILLTMASVIVEFTVENVTGVMGIISLVLAMATLGTLASPIMRICAKLSSKLSSPTIKVAGYELSREKRFTRSATLLTAGVTIAMMLFMAWSLTTSVFTSYVNEFENMVFVTNVQAGIDTDGFKDVEGVRGATKMVWGQGTISVENTDKTMNVLGSCDVLDMIDFGYITAKDDVYLRVLEDKPYVFVDIALQKLYGVQEGDTLDMTLGDVKAQVIVGGVLSHELFSGNYIVASSSMIEKTFGQKIDTVLVLADGNVDNVVDLLRAKYADNNYYVISTLEAYKWDMESMNAVFDLIGTLAIVVAIFIFAVTVATALIGRATSKKSRVAMLNAGMSKSGLLKAEMYENALVAIVALVLSFAFSVLLTSSLIHALRLFGLYFEFMYEAWVVALVGIVMAIGYSLVPIALRFKKGYTVKRV